MTANTDLSLLSGMPEVRRIRDFRLYTTKGRLVDLWLNGGAAVLGHTPPNILRELKNTASRGLYAPFPHFTKERYIKSLFKIFPGYFFRLYAAPPDELKRENNITLWRPFINEESPFAVNSASLFIPVLPGIQTWKNGLPVGLCVAAAKDESLLSDLPPDDILPPVLFAAATRGIYNLLGSPERVKPKLPRVIKALKTSGWKRQGIYLYPEKLTCMETWTKLFRKFLDAGFLLPPIPSHPLILPFGISAGEEAKLAAVLSAMLS